jgi:hypothetical protein
MQRLKSGFCILRSEAKLNNQTLVTVLIFGFLASGLVVSVTSIPIITDILLTVMGLFILFLTYIRKRLVEPFLQGLLVLGGISLAFVLNLSLSAEFLAEPMISILLTRLFFTSMMLFFGISYKEDLELHKRLSYVFLGTSLTSSIFALLVFSSLVGEWLPIHEVVGATVRVSLVVNILKSLLLSGLFALFERLTGFVKK